MRQTILKFIRLLLSLLLLTLMIVDKAAALEVGEGIIHCDDYNNPASYFITTWKTDVPLVNNQTSISFMILGNSLFFDVDWDNDGTFEDLGVTSSTLTHDYGTPGTYQVAIRGSFSQFQFGSAPDQGKLLSIDQWGDTQWTTMHSSFAYCSNLTISASDSPDLSNVTDLSSAFISCRSLTGGISNWDISNCTNLNNMLSGTDLYSENLGSWDISKVDSMRGFLDDSGMYRWHYDSTLIGWDAQSVKDSVIVGVFGLLYCDGEGARSNLRTDHSWFFERDSYTCLNPDAFVTRWKTENSGLSSNSSIRIAPPMIEGNSYNIDWESDGIIDEINVSTVIEHDYGSVGTYEVSITGDVSSFQAVLGGDHNKLISVEQWGSINWEKMDSMFKNCHNLQINAIDTPVMDLVLSTDEMFSGCTLFNSDISYWDMSSVQNMSEMFYNATSFNQDISSWDISNATSLVNMFWGATSFNQDISSWDVSNVTTIRQAFANASSFDKDIGSWDISQVEDMDNVFDYCGLSPLNYDSILIKWSSLNVKDNVVLGAINMIYCDAITERQSLINDHNWSTTDDTYNCGSTIPFVTTWKTDNSGTSGDSSITIPTIGTGYFYDVDWNFDGVYDTTGVRGTITHKYDKAGLIQIGIKGIFPRIYFNNGGDKAKLIMVNAWGDNQWSSMERAFRGCSNLDINANDNPDLSKVTSLANMFEGDTTLNADLSGWDVSNVENMSGMFYGATNFNSALDSWDVRKVTSMTDMFRDADHFNQPLNNWETDTLGNMLGIFLNAKDFNQDLSNWDVSRVIYLSSVFEGAESFNGDISTWDVGKVRQMDYMFHGASSFNRDISGWQTDTLFSIQQIFKDAKSFNQDISQWDVSEVSSSIYGAFWGATVFDQDLGDWDISNISDMTQAFTSSGISRENYDSMLIKWALQEVKNNVSSDVNGLQYCGGASARDSLRLNKGWKFNGDIVDCQFTALCRDSTFYLGSDCSQFEVILSGHELNNETIIPGGLDSFTLSQTSFGLVDTGDHIIDLTITSLAGESSTCQSTVSVVDTIEFEVSCISPEIYIGPNDSLTIEPQLVFLFTTADCVEDTTLSVHTFYASDAGNSVATDVIITDSAGRQGTCNSMVDIHSSDDCANLLFVLDNALNNDIDVNLNANFGILSNASVQAGASVLFSSSGDVFLDPGFEVLESGVFEVDNEGCQD